MNQSDTERDGRPAARPWLPTRPSMEDADLVVHQHLRSPRACRGQGDRPSGKLAELKRSRPECGSVLTGCRSPRVRESRLPGVSRPVDMFLRPRRGARTGTPSRYRLRPGFRGSADRRHRGDNDSGRRPVSAADRLAASRATALAEGRGRPLLDDLRVAAIVYGCDKTCTLLHRAFQPRPERSRPFDDIVAEARDIATAGYRN